MLAVKQPQKTNTDDPQKELFDRALKYARLYAKDCEDLTERELNDAVYEHLTKNKFSYISNIESIIKKVVYIVFNPKTNYSKPSTQEPLADDSATSSVGPLSGNRKPDRFKQSQGPRPAGPASKTSEASGTGISRRRGRNPVA